MLKKKINPQDLDVSFTNYLLHPWFPSASLSQMATCKNPSEPAQDSGRTTTPVLETTSILFLFYLSHFIY